MLNSLVLTILGLALILNQTFQASVKYGNNPCPTPGWNPCPPEIPIQPLTHPTQPPQPQPLYHPPQPQPSYHPPQPQPSYHPPQPQPSYNPPQPQPSYNPPQPQPSYNPPQPQPSYNPPQPQPSYNPPQPQPQPSYHPPQPQPQPSYHPPQPEPSYNPPQPSYNPVHPPAPSNPCGGSNQNPCTPVEHHPQPSYPQPEPSSNGNHRDNPLYCYSCNSNQPACQNPYNYTRLDIEHLVPCNGQCIRYQNPNDRYNWYRGCSWEYDFMKPQPPSVHKNGITYYFCETRGCNAIC